WRASRISGPPLPKPPIDGCAANGAHCRSQVRPPYTVRDAVRLACVICRPHRGAHAAAPDHEPTRAMTTLPLTSLTAEHFAPFGALIAPEHAAQRFEINEGTSMRFHDLARIDTGNEGGRTIGSIFRAEPRALPFAVRMLERHPLGSQAFVPLDPATRYLVVVAESESST